MYEWDIENAKTYNNRMGRYKTKCEFDFISSFNDKPMDILDIGGGSGRFAIPLFKKFKSKDGSLNNIVVLDKNEDALKMLADRCPDIECLHDDFFNASFGAGNKYDLIMAIEVLLYIEDWESFFNKTRGLLKDDGVFIFTVTNKKSWRTVLRKTAKQIMHSTDFEYTILSVPDYQNIITREAFKIESVEGFLWVPCKLDSNSPLVDLFASIESRFSFKTYLDQSPWLIYAVKKNGLKRYC